MSDLEQLLNAETVKMLVREVGAIRDALWRIKARYDQDGHVDRELQIKSLKSSYSNANGLLVIVMKHHAIGCDSGGSFSLDANGDTCVPLGRNATEAQDVLQGADVPSVDA